MPSCRYILRRILRSWGFKAFLVGIMLPLLTAWRTAFEHSIVDYFNDLIEDGAVIHPFVLWWVSRGALLIGMLVSVPIGIFINRRSFRWPIILLAPVAVVTLILQAALPHSVVMICITTGTLAGWIQMVFIGTQSYISRATPYASRTQWLLLFTFSSNEIIFHMYNAIANATDVLLDTWKLAALFAGIISFFAILLIPFPEALPAPAEQSTSSHKGESCGAVMSKAAVGLVMFLILAAYLARHVYITSLINILVLSAPFLGDAHTPMILGTTAFVVIYFLGVTAVSRYVDDRKLLLVHGLLLLLSYGLIITWGQPFSEPRFAVGAVLLSVALNVIISIAQALLSKIVPHGYVSIYLSVLCALQRTLTFAALYWADEFLQYGPSNMPYETTLGIMGFALLCMIPVYRWLLPIVYSPWSGHALPLRAESAVPVNTAHSATDRVVLGSQLLMPFTKADAMEMDQMRTPVKVYDYAGLD